MPCLTCKDTRTISRPATTRIRDIIRMVYDPYGKLVATTEAVDVHTGGIDACPTCTEKYEAEYLS